MKCDVGWCWHMRAGADSDGKSAWVSPSVPETRPLEEQDESKASDFVLELSPLYTGVVVWKSPVTLSDSEGLIYCSRHQTRGGAREMGKWEAGVILPRAASGHAYLGVHEFSACS